MNRLLYILAILIPLLTTLPVIGDPSPSATSDWSQAARDAKVSQSPIIILYTAQTCGYCERLKQEVLIPMFGHTVKTAPALLKEVDINSGGKMIDFDGEPIRSRQFKQRYHVFATPTLLILDSSGEPLTDPIVGYDSKDRYQSRLERLLEGFHI